MTKGIALAKVLSQLKPGIHENALRLAGGRYRNLSPREKLVFRAEQHQINLAKRGQIEVEVDTS